MIDFRENSFSPDFDEFELPCGGGGSSSGLGGGLTRLEDWELEASDDSGHGRSTEMSDSLSSSAPRDQEYRARALLRQATQNRCGLTRETKKKKKKRTY